MKSDPKLPGRATEENKNCVKAMKIFRKKHPLNIEKAEKGNMWLKIFKHSHKTIAFTITLFAPCTPLGGC